MNVILFLLALLTVLGDALLLWFLTDWVFTRLFKKKHILVPKFLVSFLSNNSLTLAFLVALFSTLASLFLSEIAQFPPCKFCWFQRIFMYPQVILLGIATIQNDFSVKTYSIPLSVIGLSIAIYHYILQVVPLSTSCSNEVVNCALKQFTFFGYITIPVMSATGFGLILLLMMLQKRIKTSR